MASSRSPSIVTIRSTVDVVPTGSTRIESPGLTAPPTNATGEAAEVEVRAVHPLHRHPERLVGEVVVDRHGLEEPDRVGP